MITEFHIFAFDFDRRFTVRRLGGTVTEEFSSLVDAARYIRGQVAGEEGLVVVYDGAVVNRIPMHKRV